MPATIEGDRGTLSVESRVARRHPQAFAAAKCALRDYSSWGIAEALHLSFRRTRGPVHAVAVHKG